MHLNPTYLQDNVGSASVRVLGGLDNVAGVKIPQFETQVIPGDSKMDLAGEHEGSNSTEPWVLSSCFSFFSLWNTFKHDVSFERLTPCTCPQTHQ